MNLFGKIKAGKVILFLIWLFSLHAYAFESEQIHINSDSLIINKERQSATFEGNVVLFFEDLKLTTSILIVYYADLKRQNGVSKIIIPALVKAVKNHGNEIAIADSGEFDNLTKKLTLQGNVKMQKEGNILVTDKLIYLAKLKSIGQKSNAK
jgi:lipopolysaccharide transport protein LptA